MANTLDVLVDGGSATSTDAFIYGIVAKTVSVADFTNGLLLGGM